MKVAVLVTGSAGFLGRALCRLLRGTPGIRLFSCDLRPGPGIIACDLADPESARRLLDGIRPSVIYHAAGTVRPDAVWRSHVDTTVSLLDAARGLPKPASARVVLAGSSAEYGLGGTDGDRASPRIREDAPTEPWTPYGASKLTQTLAALSFRHRGIDVRAVRIFNILGPAMPETLALGSFSAQIARIERGLQPPRIATGSLRAMRDYVHVDDAARAMILLARRGRAGEAYNVCSGRLYSIRELLDRLISLSRCRIAVIRDPRRMRGPEVLRISGDNRKIRAAAGWEPRIPMSAALRDTLEWHRSAAGISA